MQQYYNSIGGEEGKIMKKMREKGKEMPIWLVYTLLIYLCCICN